MALPRLRELALFAGAGGGILGGKLLGWRTVCAVEIEPYPRSVLLARQRDGILEPFPIWDDVKTFDGHQWRGSVDVVSGGFPCQDISAAGKGEGIGGERSGLWGEMARIIGEVQPHYVLVENSPMLVSRGLDVVLADLAALGFNARWGVIGADAAGLSHHRARLWVVANSIKERRTGMHVRKTNRQSCPDGRMPAKISPRWIEQSTVQREGGDRISRVDNGVADWSHRSEAIGNGQVPAVVRLAWKTLGNS